jgi:hypothetical protein
MLKLSKAVLLARVKLHQRPLRLVIPLIFITILFSIVFLGLSAITFLENQVNVLGRSGMNGRHIVSARVDVHNEKLEHNSSIQDRAEELYKEAIKRNTVLAKQLNVDYDPKSEETPSEIVYGQREFKPWTKYAQMAIDEWYEQNKITANIGYLERLAKPYGGFNLAAERGLAPYDSFNALIDGKEDLRRITHPWVNYQQEPIQSVTIIDSSFTNSFELDGAEQLDITNRIPIILSYSTMASQLDINNPEGESDLGTKSKLMKEIREKSLGHEIKVCFRNSVSQNHIFSVMESELTGEKPNLEYALPTEPCGASQIVADRRTSAEKDYDRRFQEFQLATGAITETEAIQEVITFVVVGVTEEPISDEQTTLTGLIQKLARQAIATPTIPSDYYERVGTATRERFEQIFGSPPIMQRLGLNNIYTVEFANQQDADRFIEENTCISTNTGCSTLKKPFLLQYGNPNSVLLDQIFTKLTEASHILMIVGTGLVVLFAFVIIALLLTNDRREISIFRAIGYKRSEIMQIYLTFAIMLATIIVISSLILGCLTGTVLIFVFYDTISITLRTIFNAPDASIFLSIWNWSIAAQVIAIGYAAVLIGSILPILINSRASIISAIRAE